MINDVISNVSAKFIQVWQQ